MAEHKAMELKRKINRLAETGAIDEALIALNALVEIDGESAFSYNKLGIISARRGEMDDAKVYFEKALTLDPRCAQAHSNLGNICREVGDLDQAIACYRQAIDCDPEYATAYHNLGVVYRQQGDFQRAVDNLKQATKLQKVMARRELSESPIGKRTPIAWLAIALLIAVLIYLIRR